LITTAEYRKEKNGAIISQVAGFESHEIMGHELSLEMHKLTETGETHVCLRKIKLAQPEHARVQEQRAQVD